MCTLTFCPDRASRWSNSDLNVDKKIPSVYRAHPLDSTCRHSLYKTCPVPPRSATAQNLTRLKTDSLTAAAVRGVSTYKITILTRHLQLQLILAGPQSEGCDAVSPPVDIRQTHATRRRALRRGGRWWWRRWRHGGMRQDNRGGWRRRRGWRTAHQFRPLRRRYVRQQTLKRGGGRVRQGHTGR